MSARQKTAICCTLNGKPVVLDVPPAERLSKVLRGRLCLEGTKVGCDAGDCGACTVLLDGEVVCACLVSAGQVNGRTVTTIEGLEQHSPIAARLKRCFAAHGAAQCGICTPGMLVAAVALLAESSNPTEDQVKDGLSGVLCRCTGYRKIIQAVLDAANGEQLEAAQPAAGAAVGARIARLDAKGKVDGTERFGADGHPDTALLARAIRSPHHRASFAFGDVARWAAQYPGIVRVFTAADIPGQNVYGVIGAFADQPVFAEAEVRFRGEAVALVVGQAAAVESFEEAAFPVSWQPLAAHTSISSAQMEDAPLLHQGRTGNILTSGHVARGDAAAAIASADVVVEGTFETGFVEHAYIEPEAGLARRVGNTIEITACTQSPYMDRDDVARILGLLPEAVRIIPTAVGGGFGGKLDLAVQPFIAVAAWSLNLPVRMVFSRVESMMATTKRHPSRIHAKVAANRDGKLAGMDFQGDFNTGAYASWGPTVANRVPVHASGPYFVPNYQATASAIHTNLVPAGAFRGFGVPQAAIAQEQLFDDLALRLGLDPLEFRIANALRADQPTVTGQVLGQGVGIRQCLEALRPDWRRALASCAHYNEQPSGVLRRGVGVAGMWYGCGNTSLPNPSTILAGIKPDGRVSLHQGAVDIGQGSNTVITQVFADALGAPLGCIDLVSADTALTPDCGKTSASRQTFVTGKAAELAGRKLRNELLRAANAGDKARLQFDLGRLAVIDGDRTQVIDLAKGERDIRGYVFSSQATFDPPTTTLDAGGQGSPYAVYGFGAQMAEVEVDMALGTVKVLKITAAHDVGRAINPTLVEGQIEGGVAQGLGMALMEEFHPGRGENLHDYLIPTIGDMPEVHCILIEEASPVGPFGAKGIGEQALIPTAPAILNAIYAATGVRIHRIPATPDRILAAIKAAGATVTVP